LPHLPEDAVAQLVDGAERVAHAEEASPYDRVRGPGDRTSVYEELADDPVAGTKRVLSFRGLPTDVEPRPLTVKMDRNRCRPG
jgi:hypothetical protein